MAPASVVFPVPDDPSIMKFINLVRNKRGFFKKVATKSTVLPMTCACVGKLLKF